MKTLFEFKAEEGQEVCDFCAAKPVYAAYDCVDFEMITPVSVVIGQISKEPWAACAECARLIDSEQWNSLLNRSCREFKAENGIMSHEIRKMLSSIQQQFRAHRRAAN